jgi:hypothetical protein
MFTSKDRSGSSDTTPPQSFVKSLLTPPLTDELHTLRLSEERHPSPVATVIQAFRNIQQGRSDFEPGPWARFKLEPIQFEDLLRELEGDESLRGYVDDKIRYVPKVYNVHCNFSLIQTRLRPTPQTTHNSHAYCLARAFHN